MAHPRIAIAPNDDPRWSLAKSGDLVARNSLVEEHIRLLDQVTAVVCAKLPTYASREDIWSFGSFGLIRAVETYDPSIASFRTHAVFLIKARIYDELRSMDWAPKSVRKKIRDVDSTRAVLQAQGSEATDRAVAQVLGVDVSHVEEVEYAKRTTSMTSLDEYEQPDIHMSQASTPSAHNVAEYLHMFGDWVDTLTEDEQAVWSLRFYCKMTTKQTAVMLGVPAATVSRISTRIFTSFHQYVDTMLVAS